jgi:hypothetical protein
MQIKKEYPPNINDITAKFPLTLDVVFTYGDTIYSPARVDLPKHLRVHEETHSKYQLEMGVEAWWKRYIEDDKFRLYQEIVAYQNQYKQFCKDKKNIQRQYFFLDIIARDLSSKLYGNLVTYEEAKNLIKNL